MRLRFIPSFVIIKYVLASVAGAMFASSTLPGYVWYGILDM